MKTFSELLEAKITPDLLRTVPHAPGERNFYDKHIKFDILKNFRQEGNEELFNGKIVNTFPRKENHFGNDEDQSIQAYESEKLEEKQKVIFINGKWVKTSPWDKTNKEAYKNYRKENPDVKGIKIRTVED